MATTVSTAVLKAVPIFAMLPEEQREAFLMKHGEGLSYDEMADLACASVSAMKMRVHRATEALRDHLAAVRSTL